MKYPIEAGNIALIVLGAVLVLSGPFIIYKTVVGIRERRKADPQARIHWFSNGLNFVIAVLFFLAGILFIVNNLRGNPLAAEAVQVPGSVESAEGLDSVGGTELPE